MTLVAAGTIVIDGRVCRPGWLLTSGDRIADCGSGTPPRPVDREFPHAVAVPGFVDIHAHGGGGASYADTDGAEEAVALHRRYGTTSILASLMTAAPDSLLRAVRALGKLTRRGVIAGIHLEGPWLSPARCGAHDPAQLRTPRRTEIDALLAAGDGAVRMVTLAPELPGGIEVIRHFVDAGVVVAVGHTDASYEQTRQAIAAGATVGTHLFNAMRPLHHRDPGPALALLEDPRLTVELIADGVHVHPGLVRYVIGTAGPGRVALITDAMAAAGLGDGSFRLGGLDVDVVSGAARVRGRSTIVGGTATMDQLFRTAVGCLGSSDAALTAAVQLTATTPARALGLDHVGSLRTGLDANLVMLDQTLEVTDVMTNGQWQNTDYSVPGKGAVANPAQHRRDHCD